MPPLRNLVDWGQRQLDEMAPHTGLHRLERGPYPLSRRRGVPTVKFACKKCSGQANTPLIGKNQPLFLHSLPARRPLAVLPTILPGFGGVGYPDVRKDMRGRYPKTPWPEKSPQKLSPRPGQSQGT